MNPAWVLIDLNIDLEKGLRYAEQAVRVFPDSPYNNGTLGCGCYKKGDLENAEKYLTAAINLFPVYAPQRLLLVSRITSKDLPVMIERMDLDAMKTYLIEEASRLVKLMRSS